ncbi:MAG TPA: ABC transporter permease [Egibacteraceae bacterium]|nr:ABC transporter permease [Egibacteraceae bacterium]
MTIAAKELRQRARDRSIFIIGIAVPLTLAGILSFALSDTDEDFTASYALVDADGGELSRPFVQALDSLDFAEISRVESVGEARRLVDQGDAAAAFVIPAGFSAAVQSGEGGQLEVIADPESPIGAQIAESLARSFASDLNAVQLSIAAVAAFQGDQADPGLLAQAEQQARTMPPPAIIEPVAAADRQTSAQTFFAIGMAVFFMFFTVEFGVRSILEERQTGTMARLLAAPLAPSAILAGKALATFIVGAASMAVLVVATDVLLGAEWGDPGAVAVLVAAGVLAAMALTALVATLARTPQQASSYASVVAVTLGLLGGAFFPLGEGLLATVGLATPHAWLLRGMRDVAGGSALSDVLIPLAAVLAFAAVFGVLAVARAGKLVERP